MKKIHFFLAVSAIALASCASDDYVGDNPEGTLTNDGRIAFTAGSNAMTRATLVGQKAAEKLNNKFVVYGTKHGATAEDATDTNDKKVFDQYQVEWSDNSAGTTTTNTHNWEYVGKTSYSSAVTGKQTVKYWDESAANGYTFYAFSSANISYPANSADLVTVTKTTTGAKVYDKGYTVTAKTGADLNKMFYSDRKTVAQADYGKPVTLTFRNFGSRVRVGFYETVPGYKVKINKFYYANGATTPVTTYKAMAQENTTHFAAALQNVKTNATNNEFTVSYYDNTDASVENHVKVTNKTVGYDYTLTLGTAINTATELKTSSSDPTWDKASGEYTTVYPFEANTNPMLIRVDYTLTSEDGSGETIEVKNARVVVPSQYVQWKSNFAYTYLFKISDNTNGTSGKTPSDPDDPSTGGKEGLFPITFDAVVEEATDNSQETVTTIATNSITTYAKGSAVTTNHEYKAGDDVRVVVSNTATGHAVIVPSGIGTENGNAQVYTVATTNEAISEATVKANLTGIKNGITLTPITPAAEIANDIDMADGTKKTVKNVKFTVASGKKYAFVYTTTKYVAATYASVSAATSTYDSSKTYFMKTANDVYYAAAGINEANFEANKANLYTQTNAGTAGVYDVKIINVK